MKKVRDKTRAAYVVSVHEPADQRQHPVWKMFDRPIAFHRGFVTLTGSVTAALMLSQAVYWSQRSLNPAGWFYKTADDWEEETGLTRREQETARKRLRRFPWWQEELRKANGVPTLYYRIDAVGFAQMIASGFTNLCKPVSPNDEIPTVSPNDEIPINIDYQRSPTDTTGGGSDAEKKKERGAVHKCWQENMPGMMTSIIAEEIDDLIDEYGPQPIIHAITVAVNANVRNMRYVKGVLTKGESRASPVNGNGNHKNATVTVQRMEGEDW